MILLGLLLSSADARDVCAGLEVRRSDDPQGPSLVVKGRVGDLELADGAPRLRQDYFESGMVQVAVPAGREVTWDLDDSSRVVLVNGESIEPVTLALGTESGVSTATRWKLVFPLTEDVVHAMARARPTRLRYTLHAESQDLELRPAQGASMQRLFACFANQWAASTPPS